MMLKMVSQGRSTRRGNQHNMKLRKILVVLAASLAFGVAANANMIPVTNDGNGTDDNFNQITGGGNQNVVIFEWLKGEILSYNNHVPGANLPNPTDGLIKLDNLNGNGPTINVVAGDYVVLHYGAGQGGVAGSGGGLVALFFNANQSFTVPNNGSGPNGFGGISFVDIWDHTANTVPDGGMTLALLGGALIGLGLIRVKFSC
jgi:hypothetical protein